ncbi:hypothetical protein [Demequina sp.]|uniref:hypothetical protein n=1 Tax=Demequina sp. TaxID=2050685 RepID=UPI003D1445CE
MDAGTLTAGIVGRRFLLELASRMCEGGADLSSTLAAAPAPTHVRQLREALYESFQTAIYWGPRDDRDELSDSPGLADAISAYARRVEQTQLLEAAFAVTGEQVQVTLSRPQEVSLGEQTLTAHEWRRQLIESVDSFAAARRGRVGSRVSRVPLSGAWWSAPVGLPQTSDVWLGGVPVQLFGVEDDRGHELARVTHIANLPGKILEISGPEVWVGLVREFPLDVTELMADTWGKAFPGRGVWHLPDWDAISRRWDAVYLPLSGSLTTAGMALPVGDQVWTVLAGFDAGTTFWLSNEPQSTGDSVLWRRPSDSAQWSE